MSLRKEPVTQNPTDTSETTITTMPTAQCSPPNIWVSPTLQSSGGSPQNCVRYPAPTRGCIFSIPSAGASSSRVVPSGGAGGGGAASCDGSPAHHVVWERIFPDGASLQRTSSTVSKQTVACHS